MKEREGKTSFEKQERKYERMMKYWKKMKKIRERTGTNLWKRSREEKAGIKMGKLIYTLEAKD